MVETLSAEGFIHLDQLPILLNEEFNDYYIAMPGVSDSYVTQVGSTNIGFGDKTMLKRVINFLYKKFPDGIIDASLIKVEKFPQLIEGAPAVTRRRGVFEIQQPYAVYLDELKRYFSGLDEQMLPVVIDTLCSNDAPQAIRAIKSALNFHTTEFDDIVLSVCANFRVKVLETLKGKDADDEKRHDETTFAPSLWEISEGGQDTLKVQNETPTGLSMF